jgi:hypothetical protein
MAEEVIIQVEKMGTFNSAFDMDESDSDDMSLRNYSIISQNELADLAIMNQTQVEANETYIPDTVPSQANNTQFEGVDSEFEHTEDVLSDSEELESEDDRLVDSSNDEELKGNHEGLITTDITHDNAGEQGRNVNLRKDLFENYEFLQKQQLLQRQK